MEKIIAAILICGIVIVTAAYQIGGNYFWQMHDFGQILFPIAALIYVKNSFIISCACWVWFGGCFNALLTSLLFDISKMEVHQKISLCVISLAVIAVGVVHTYKTFIKRKIQEQSCKRTARKQYKEIRHRVESIEKRINKYDNALEKFFNDLIEIR